MKRLLLLFFLFLFPFFLSSCIGNGTGVTSSATDVSSQQTEPSLPPETEPVTEVQTSPVSEDPNAVKYQVIWVLKRDVYRVKVAEGTIPTPPTDYNETYEKDKATWTFIGWDKEITPVSGNTVYTAQYDVTYTYYDVTFIVDGKETVVPTRYNQVPSAPIYVGKTILWSKPFAAVTEPTIYYGSDVSGRSDIDYLTWVFGQKEMYYSNTKRKNDNDGGGLTSSVALFYLLYLQRTDPNVPSVVLHRILLHFEKVLGGNGYEPMFQCCCNWNYPVLLSCYALAKNTPSVWNSLSADLKERMDFQVQCFAVTCAFGTDDNNSYNTGVDFYGNYNKDWNPNYRLANVPNILLATAYFGSADTVNNILLNFDYDTYIAKFDKYNYPIAKNAWSTEVYNDSGTLLTTTKKVMMNGGKAYYAVDLERNNQVKGASAGTGKGVRTTYSYQGYSLKQIPKIMNALLKYNYSGGKVFSTYSEQGTPLAYILDGSTSPMEGKNGMMLEFNSSDASGVRVSASYCCHDITMIVVLLETFEELGYYNITDYSDVFELAYVGNTDLIYKLEKGFMSHSWTGNSETHESWSNGYMLVKYLWNKDYAPKYKGQ